MTKASHRQAWGITGCAARSGAHPYEGGMHARPPLALRGAPSYTVPVLLVPTLSTRASASRVAQGLARPRSDPLLLLLQLREGRPVQLR